MGGRAEERGDLRRWEGRWEGREGDGQAVASHFHFNYCYNHLSIRATFPHIFFLHCRHFHSNFFPAPSPNKAGSPPAIPQVSSLKLLVNEERIEAVTSVGSPVQFA